jgi:hypothetical protein
MSGQEKYTKLDGLLRNIQTKTCDVLDEEYAVAISRYRADWIDIADEIESLRKALAEKEELIKTLIDVKEASVDLKDNQIVGKLKSNIIPIIAEAIVAQFKACGGENYVEWTLTHQELGELILRLERKGGKTTAEVNGELQKRAKAKDRRIEELVAEIADKRNVLISLLNFVENIDIEDNLSDITLNDAESIIKSALSTTTGSNMLMKVGAAEKYHEIIVEIYSAVTYALQACDEKTDPTICVKRELYDEMRQALIAYRTAYKMEGKS